MKRITLVDGSSFSVSLEILQIFDIFKIFEGYEDEVYPVLHKDIDQHTFENILQFCEYFVDHKFNQSEIQRPLPEAGLVDAVPEVWYYDYISKFSIEELHSIIMASNYLGIDTMITLGCAQVANLIRNKKLEEVAEMFKDLKPIAEE